MISILNLLSWLAYTHYLMSGSPFSSANCFASSYVTSLWASRSALFPMRMITWKHTHEKQKCETIAWTEKSPGEICCLLQEMIKAEGNRGRLKNHSGFSAERMTLVEKHFWDMKTTHRNSSETNGCLSQNTCSVINILCSMVLISWN